MSHKIDTTGATLTPEMAQKGETVVVKTEEVTKEEVVVADEKAEDTKSEDTAKAEADAKAKAESETKEDLQPKKRSIYDDLKDKKKEVKEAKSEAEIAKAENQALKAEIEALKVLTKSAKAAVTDDEKEEVEDDIKEVAESIGGDPKAIKTLTDFLTKKLVKNDSKGISKDDIEEIKNFKKAQADIQAEVEFSKEWKSFVPSLKKDYPHISDAELENVQQEISKLAHSQSFHDKEIDYIYFKQKNSLSKLISPKRQSMEPAGNGGGDVETTVASLSSKSSPMDVMNAVKTDKRSPSELEVRRGR